MHTPRSVPTCSPQSVTESPTLAGHTPSTSLFDFMVDVANMLKAFIGINFMMVAYGFSKAGMLRGTIGLVIITFLTEHCCLLLVDIKESMHRPIGTGVGVDDHRNDEYANHSDRQNTGSINLTDPEDPSPPEDGEYSHQDVPMQPAPSYGDIAYFAGGRNAERMVNIALIVTQFGYCVGYLIFISQALHDVVSSATPVQFFVLIPLPILAALSALRSIRSLGPFSVLANGALLCGFAAVVAYIARHFRWAPATVPLSSFPLFFGQMTASLEGIGLIIPVQSSMKNPRLFPLVLRIALVVLVTILMVVGIMGFATFGAETHSIILLNFGQSPVVVTVKAVLIVGILFTYPLQIIPVYEFMERILLSRFNQQHPRLDEMEQSDFGTSATAAASTGRLSEPRHQIQSAMQRPHFQLADEDDDISDANVRRSNFENGTVGNGRIDLDRNNNNTGHCNDRDQGSGGGVQDVAGIRNNRISHAGRDDSDEAALFVKDRRCIAIRLGVVVLTGGVAVVAGASFGLFQALVGSLGASALAYTAPALLHYMAFRDQLSRTAKVKDLGIVIFGVVGAVIGTATSVWEIVQIHRGNASPT